MWSETIGCREYRHPYLPDFFRGVAAAIPLTGTEDLLDLGCGVGEVALGFAPFVASLTGMDLEQPMLDALGNRALAMGINMRLINSRVEDELIRIIGEREGKLGGLIGQRRSFREAINDKGRSRGMAATASFVSATAQMSARHYPIVLCPGRCASHQRARHNA